MRDPKRISKFCDRLAAAWSTVPDLRFGQLMTNVLSSYINEKISNPFYLEDDEMIAYIEGYLYGTGHPPVAEPAPPRPDSIPTEWVMEHTKHEYPMDIRHSAKVMLEEWRKDNE